MITNINLKRDFKIKSTCKNYVLEKLHVYSHRVLIKHVIISLELLHDDLMRLILKEKRLLIVYNETLYVYILLNDAT